MKYYWWKFNLLLCVILGRGLILFNQKIEQYYKAKGDFKEALNIHNRTDELSKKVKRWNSLI